MFQLFIPFPRLIFFDPLIASLWTPTRVSGATIYTQVHFAQKSTIENITLHTSKPLSRPMKASFNPLFTDRILSTTVPIKVRCSSETDACCNMSINVSGASGPRTDWVIPQNFDSPGLLALVPVRATHLGAWASEVLPLGPVFTAPRATR